MTESVLLGAQTYVCPLIGWRSSCGQVKYMVMEMVSQPCWVPGKECRPIASY